MNRTALQQTADQMALARDLQQVGLATFASALAAGRAAAARQSHSDSLLACRALARSLPQQLTSREATQLLELVDSWLAPPSSSGAGPSPSAVALQLQSEALRLVMGAIKEGNLALQQSQQVHLLRWVEQVCRSAQLGRPPSTTTASPRPVAYSELLCTCMDVLAQLSKLQCAMRDLAEAVRLACAVLEQQSRAFAAGRGHAAQDDPATTRLLCKLLRALQALLAEARHEHGASLTALVPCLQQLLCYGWQPQLTAKPSAAAPGSADVLAAPGAARTTGDSSTGRSSRSGEARRYLPPHARRSVHDASTSGAELPGPSTPQSCQTTQQQPQSKRANAVHSRLPQGLCSESSDSETSDSEGAGPEQTSRWSSTRVRLGALTCLQLLAKADAKALQPSWPALLPTSSLTSVAPGQGAGPGAWGRCPPNLALVLLFDPQHRIRHAAAIALTTLLEGPAQRTYLGIAEAREAATRLPARGFTTLSVSLGQMVASLHAGLLRSLGTEEDPWVLAAALRALGTLILGSPYHRLQPQLLPECVAALHACLVRCSDGVAGNSRPASTAMGTAEGQQVASACLACLAAAFGSRAPESAALLVEQACAAAANSSVSLVQLLLAYAGSRGGTASHAAGSSTARQLEATMALRGLSQQYPAALNGCWQQLLALTEGAVGARLDTVAPPSPRTQQQHSASAHEKLAQQAVQLVGDLLTVSDGAVAAGGRAGGASLAATISQGVTTPSNASSGASCTAADVDLQSQLWRRWEEATVAVVAVAVQHDSPLVRAAAHGVAAGVSATCAAQLPEALLCQLLCWSCQAASQDAASSVRAAAAKAAGALAAAQALCVGPGKAQQVLPALQDAGKDAVLAVRVQAAAALATLCQALRASEERGRTGTGSTGLGVEALQAALCLATAAARDGDKVRASGVEALGSLFGLAACGGDLAELDEQQRRAWEVAVVDAVVALAACLGPPASARVQWSACGAAGQLLHAVCNGLLSGLPALARPVVQPLCDLVQWAAHHKTRALAAAALRAGCSAATYGGEYTRALCGTVDALHSGKASGWAVERGGVCAAAAQQQQDQLEPVDFSARANLEAQVVATVLHLLSVAIPGDSALPSECGNLQQLAVMAVQALRHEMQHDAVAAQLEAATHASTSPVPAAAGDYDLSAVVVGDGIARRAAAGLLCLSGRAVDDSHDCPALLSALAEWCGEL